jgi:hypothetical protein
MIKRVLLIGACFPGFCFSLAAQQSSQIGQLKSHGARSDRSRDIAAFDPSFTLGLYRPGIIGAAAGSALLPVRPGLTLLDGDDLLPEIGLAPLDLFPVASSDVAAEQKVNATTVHRSTRKNSGTDGKDSPVEIVSPPWNRIYYGGEVGVFYGRWNGKYGGDIVETYFRGDVGNEKFHIGVGAAYGELNSNLPGVRCFTGPR